MFITLYNIFNAYLDELTEDNIVKSKIDFKETLIWSTLYRFKKYGAMGVIDKIEKYNCCIVADSVGLNKEILKYGSIDEFITLWEAL